MNIREYFAPKKPVHKPDEPYPCAMCGNLITAIVRDGREVFRPNICDPCRATLPKPKGP